MVFYAQIYSNFFFLSTVISGRSRRPEIGVELIGQEHLQPVLGPPGTQGSPQYSNRSQDCHFASPSHFTSPTQTQLGGAQEQDDVEQDHPGSSLREGTSAGGETDGLRVGHDPSFTCQGHGDGQARKALEKDVPSSMVTDQARSDSEKVPI